MPSPMIAVSPAAHIPATIVKSGCAAECGRLPPGEYEVLRGNRASGTAVLSPKRHGRDAEWVYYFVTDAGVWADVRERVPNQPAAG